MVEQGVSRLEILEAVADIDGDMALLTVRTSEGPVAYEMKRAIFIRLFQEMRLALAQQPGSGQPPAEPDRPHADG